MGRITFHVREPCFSGSTAFALWNHITFHTAVEAGVGRRVCLDIDVPLVLYMFQESLADSGKKQFIARYLPRRTDWKAE